MSSDPTPAPDRTKVSLPRQQSLTFDVVIATRNRPEALELSIPLILSQSRLPEKLIVIDSSDDHDPVAATVARAVADARETSGWTGEVICQHSPRGLPLQRNRGLTHVTADVVFFPDDDSLLHPGTAAALMRIYEADTEGAVAGVGAADARNPPAGALPEGAYRRTAAHEGNARARPIRNRIERIMPVLNPNYVIGRALSDRHPLPPWLESEDCVPVEWMNGYRMTFRRSALEAQHFDEALKGYALAEDIDASFQALRRGLLIGALKAQIYHHHFPAARSRAFAMGVMAVLNRTYVTMKILADGAFTPREIRKVQYLLSGFLIAKLLHSLILLPMPAGSLAELRGVCSALLWTRALRRAPRAELARVYGRAQDRLLGNPGG